MINAENVIKRFTEMTMQIAEQGGYDRGSGAEIIKIEKPNVSGYVFERKVYFWKKDERTDYLLRVTTALGMETIIDSEWVSVSENE